MSRSLYMAAGWAAGLWLCLAPAAHAAHPLITEDTGTQGQGHFQFELTNETTRVRETGQRQYVGLTTAVFTYGFIDTADVLVTVPWLKLGQPDSSRGLADVGLDIKWRFYETGPISVALKPGITFPTGDDTRNLGTGRTDWSLYLVTTADFKPWAFHLHLGHLHHNNLFNERVDIWHASAAAAWQAADTVKLVVDAGVDTNTDRTTDFAPLFAIIGAVWSPRPHFDIDLGLRTERSDTQRALVTLAGLTYRW